MTLWHVTRVQVVTVQADGPIHATDEGVSRLNRATAAETIIYTEEVKVTRA